MGKLTQSLNKNLITGLLVILPVALTFFLLAFVIRGIDHAMAPAVAKIIRDTGLPLPEDFQLPGLGLILILLFIFSVGLLASNFAGRKLVNFGHWVVEKIPLVRTIYLGVKKLVDTLSESQAPTFEKLVVVEYPREGTMAIGVICCPTGGELKEAIGQGEFSNVFIPCTPNVTAGFLLFMPQNQILNLDISREEGLKTVISFGTVTSPGPEAVSSASENEDPGRPPAADNP